MPLAGAVGRCVRGWLQGPPTLHRALPLPAPFAPDAESGPAPGTLIWGNSGGLGSLVFLQAVVTLALLHPVLWARAERARTTPQVQPVVAPGLFVALLWKAGQRRTEFSTLVPVATACTKLADRATSSGAQTGVSPCHPRSSEGCAPAHGQQGEK